MTRTAQQIIFGSLNKEKQFGRPCSKYGEGRGACVIFMMEISEGRGPLGRPGRRWKGNIKWIFKTWDEERYIDCIDLAQGRDRWRAVVIAVMNLRFP